MRSSNANRYVTAAALLAAITTAMLIFYGRW